MADFTQYNNVSRMNITRNDTINNTGDFSLVLATTFTLLSVYNSAVNGLVLILFLKSKTLHQNCLNSLVLCLSISDFTLGISGIIAGLRNIYRECSMQYETCTTQVIMTFVSIIMSFMQTFLISFQRYLITASERHANILEGNRKYIIYVISWVSAVTWCILWLPSNHKSSFICDVEYLYEKNTQIMALSFSSINITFFILTVVLYFITLNHIRKRYSRTFAWQIEMNGKARRSTERKNQGWVQLALNGKKKVYYTLKTVGIIIILLFVLTGPIVVIMLLIALGWTSNLKGTALGLSCCLATLNSSLNPFIYPYKLKEFRQEFKKHFLKVKHVV